MIHPKLRGNYALSQNFHTKKLGEISVFYAVTFLSVYSFYDIRVFRAHEKKSKKKQNAFTINKLI